VGLKTVATGEEALEKLATQQFDLIVLDMKMAPMGGEEVYREIQKRKIKTEIIIVTGLVEFAEKLQVENPTLRVFTKQLNFSQFQKCLKGWILEKKASLKT